MYNETTYANGLNASSNVQPYNQNTTICKAPRYLKSASQKDHVRELRRQPARHAGRPAGWQAASQAASQATMYYYHYYYYYYYYYHYYYILYCIILYYMILYYIILPGEWAECPVRMGRMPSQAARQPASLTVGAGAVQPVLRRHLKAVF